MPFHRKWTRQKDRRLKEMRAAGASLRAISAELDVSSTAVSKRLERLAEGVAPTYDDEPLGEITDIHPSLTASPTLERQQDRVRSVASYRRGAKVPACLEPEYFELLKQGLPIADALKRLGITPSRERL